MTETERATARPCPMCGNDLDGWPVVCGGCQARGERDLRDLPRLASALLGIARDPSRRTGEPVSGSREKPLPLQTGVWSFVGLPSPGPVRAQTPGDALCQVGQVPLADALWSEADAIADDLGDVSPPRIRRNTSADAATERIVAFLLAQHHRAVELPWADEYLPAVHRLWVAARTYADDWPLVHKLPAPCPYCHTLTLRRDNGARWVYCDDRDGGCDRRWTEDDYGRLVHILVSEAEGAGWRRGRTASTSRAAS